MDYIHESFPVNIKIPDYYDIDELQKHGIGMADISKLKAAGICTVRVRWGFQLYLIQSILL